MKTIPQMLELVQTQSAIVKAYSKEHGNKPYTIQKSEGLEDEFNALCSILADLEDRLSEMLARDTPELIAKAKYFLSNTTSPPEAFENIAADLLRLFDQDDAQGYAKAA